MRLFAEKYIGGKVRFFEHASLCNAVMYWFILHWVSFDQCDILVVMIVNTGLGLGRADQNEKCDNALKCARDDG